MNEPFSTARTLLVCVCITLSVSMCVCGGGGGGGRVDKSRQVVESAGHRTTGNGCPVYCL